MSERRTDRLHALDAVRAYALILGIFLHATMAFLDNLPAGMWVYADTPSTTLAALFFVIHMFRMSAFFFIAGFFARMVIERRGLVAFLKDRLKRIGIPLVFGLPIILATIIGAYIAAASLAGIDLQAIFEAQAQVESLPGYFPWAHLWFLYYLVLFYIGAVAIRAMILALDKNERGRQLADKIAAFIIRGPWGVLILALPVALYYFQHHSWITWSGMPSSFVIFPEKHILIAYGVPFAFGWLMHRQIPLLLALESHWRMYLTIAIVLTAISYAIAGPTPIWDWPYLAGMPRAIFTTTYMIGQWCWIFAFIGLAVRFWSDDNPWRRYLADASYWLYLMHITPLVFLHTLLGPLAWHWSIKYALCIVISLPLLLVSYHYLVRATWIGVLLNGRRYPRVWPSAARQSSL